MDKKSIILALVFLVVFIAIGASMFSSQTTTIETIYDSRYVVVKANITKDLSTIGYLYYDDEGFYFCERIEPVQVGPLSSLGEEESYIWLHMNDTTIGGL